MSEHRRNQFLKSFRNVSFALLAVSFAGGLLAGCASRLDIRGNLPDPDQLKTIKVGQQTREQVEELLGSPSSIAPFDGKSWYYVAERVETFAFFEPELRERQVIVLKFDKKGVVSDIKTINMAQGYDVRMVERVTPTSGSEIGIFEQLIGNMGRFDR